MDWIQHVHKGARGEHETLRCIQSVMEVSLINQLSSGVFMLSVSHLHPYVLEYVSPFLSWSGLTGFSNFSTDLSSCTDWNHWVLFPYYCCLVHSIQFACLFPISIPFQSGTVTLLIIMISCIFCVTFGLLFPFRRNGRNRRDRSNTALLMMVCWFIAQYTCTL